MSDVVFDTRLTKRSLIEASAGTGKTYALAGLFVRAVIERRLRVPQILTVTYTDAATQELRARIRQRLERAEALIVNWQEEGDADEDAETVMLRRLLRNALHYGSGETLTSLRWRLAQAMRDLDLAAISTIHGFCRRVLAEHAIEAAQPLLAVEIETHKAATRAWLSVELWRESADDPSRVAFLRGFFGDLKGLERAIGDLLGSEPLLPQAPEIDLVSKWQRLFQTYVMHGEQARHAIEQAVAQRVLSRDKNKSVPVEALWGWFMQQNDRLPIEVPSRLNSLTPQALLAICLNNKEGQCPESPLFGAVEEFLYAWGAEEIQRLHALRKAARRRDAAYKASFNVRDYDDLISAVHEAAVDPRIGPRLAAALRAQFPLVLVDEFQDTDARQWAIFDALFGDGGLVLVGDPKQAIYRFRGGDVHAYLQARASAEEKLSLQRNFRSRPVVLAAIEALFAQVQTQVQRDAEAQTDVLGEGIAFEPVAPGGNARDDDLRLDDAPAPALAFHIVPAREDGRAKDWTKEDSIRIAAALCADAIRDRLQLARDGRLLRRDGATGSRPIEPRDCAVLVRTHREADAVRRALARRGVPAVASGRISLFETEEADELLTLLLALRESRDDRRLRAALATRLLGCTAADIDALDEDSHLLRDWQQRFEDWRTRWERHGPQALIAQVVAEHAARLLAEADGERRVTNLLQLGELLQEAGSRKLGTQGQLDWLRGAIATAEPDDEAQQPRLESDAGRVHILTLHKSKGLEYPLVFLPFVGIGRDPQRNLKVAVYPYEGQRVRQWKTEQTYPGAPSWDEAVRRHVEEDRAEDMRLLYVGLTRAREALWLCGGALAEHAGTALQRLLQGETPSSAVRERLGSDLLLSEGLPEVLPQRLPPSPTETVPPARVATRRLQRDWWIHSFSQLHQQKSQGAQALADEAPADDERVTLPGTDPRLGGTRFGNALHHALEHVDFSVWRDRGGEDIPPSQREILFDALRSQRYRDDDLDAGLHALASLVARTLNVRLPEGVRLCELAPEARVSELEFHFALRGTTTRDLLRLLQTHGLLQDRHDFGAWSQLSGLMTGKLDLTYRVGERTYVLDYKSNQLPSYDQAALAERMRASEYDLQALLYAVALQRWLRLRLGAAYDFDRHFGGARYVFCRGLDARHDFDDLEPARGIFVPELPRVLVDAAEALLAGDP